MQIRYRSYSALFMLALALYAAQPWKSKDSADWTASDIQELLADSPWAKSANASFGAAGKRDPDAGVPLPGAPQAGMADSRGVSDGRWDGGISRNKSGGTPSLPVLVRWDSALPIREALSKSASEDRSAEVPGDYVVTVLGLVPGGPNSQNSEMLKELESGTILAAGSKTAVHPDDVKVDRASGAVHFLFLRTTPITLADKEVTFATRFGTLRVQRSFRLKDMLYRGKLEL